MRDREGFCYSKVQQFQIARVGIYIPVVSMLHPSLILAVIGPDYF